MPRRKPRSENQTANPVLPDEPVLMLGTAHPTHKREHVEDAYKSLPGAVVPRGTTREPKKNPTPADRVMQQERLAEQHVRADRYARYLDALAENGGDQEGALAEVYGLTVEAVRLQRSDLQEDVRSGIGSSSLAQILERNDLSMAARAHVLRRHVYSESPAASLKALDMVGELDGARGADMGSFEQFLRLAKGQT